MVLYVFYQYVVEQVDVVDEFVDQVVCWGFVDVYWVVDLFDVVQVYDGDVLGYGYGFFLVVGYYYVGYVDVFDDFYQFQLYL